MIKQNGWLDNKNTVLHNGVKHKANDTPLLDSASLMVTEGATVTLNAANFAINDPDDSSFTYNLSGISGGYFQLTGNPGTPITSFTSAQLSAGEVQFVDGANESAPSFSVTLNDGEADSNTLAASVSYTPAKSEKPLYGLMACEKAPLVYMNIPKSGCTSIKCFMYYLENGKFPDNPLEIHRMITQGLGLVHMKQHKLLNQLYSNRKLSFTFVRHPLRRAYSCFLEKIFFVHAYSFPRIRKALIRHFELQLPPPDKIAAVLDSRGMATNYTVDIHRDNFKAFLKFIIRNHHDKTPRIRKDPHWGVQYEMIRKFQNRAIIDFIGRLENFNRDFPMVLSMAGVKEHLPYDQRFNEGPKFYLKIEEIFDDEINDLAYEIYHDDYYHFGYDNSAMSG